LFFGTLHGSHTDRKLVWATWVAATKYRYPLEATDIRHVNTPCSITTVRTPILAAFGHTCPQEYPGQIW